MTTAQMTLYFNLALAAVPIALLLLIYRLNRRIDTALVMVREMAREDAVQATRRGRN